MIEDIVQRILEAINQSEIRDYPIICTWIALRLVGRDIENAIISDEDLAHYIARMTQKMRTEKEQLETDHLK